MSSTVFCYSYRDHRDLHSFPTRRSSDLSSFPKSTCRACTAHTATPGGFASVIRPTAGTGRSCATARRPSTSGPHSGGRSEEHTSELQSQSNLVCRLLLEKKKNTNNL